ncbi:hypothetical protein C6P40_001691 [Pichia californica]|uniref:Uncharacterized protein n=1 Tax=Pichia californica TaxID=460514 RepID=A0A9P6WPK3_9ASCO|nr:hypothetical protein C6P42_002916 [[Candida] californica]KAG0690746.1 hypothetical protein C6P40_001691 [[Candida] californica]
MFRKSTTVYQRSSGKISHYIPPTQRAIIQHKEYAKEKRKSDLLGKIVHYGFFTLISGSVLMYLWQPWNPYSKDVSKELRKGLWQERDGKEDYMSALKYYQNALQVAKEEDEMNQLSMKYTGIVLKIAEMYQNLKMTDNLIKTYYNLSTFIFENLIQGNISKENPERDLLIDRDLIVITRWAVLLQQEKPENWYIDLKNEIWDRIIFIENSELLNKFPWLVENFKNKKINTEELIDIWAESTFYNLDIKHIKHNQWVEENIKSDSGKEFLKCWDMLRYFNDKEWPIWIESYLKMRDYYAMLQMKLGNFPLCIQLLQSNLLWSSIGGFYSAINCTTQIHNIASAWFQLGQSKNDIKAYIKSKLIYEKLITKVDKNDPILPIVYYSLGIISMELGEKQISTKYFDKSRILAVQMDQLQVVDRIDDALLGELKKK